MCEDETNRLTSSGHFSSAGCHTIVFNWSVFSMCRFRTPYTANETDIRMDNSVKWIAKLKQYYVLHNNSVQQFQNVASYYPPF